MNKSTNILLGIILVVLLLDLTLTGIIFLRQRVQVSGLRTDMMKSRTEDFDPEIAKVLGKKVVEMYNQQNHQALYALFNEQAKVKISHKQLETKLKKLFQMFGEIEERAFVSADKIGEKGDGLYYKLLFNIRVKETSKRFATLTIAVVMKDKKMSLYGVRINASQSLD